MTEQKDQKEQVASNKSMEDLNKEHEVRVICSLDLQNQETEKRIQLKSFDVLFTKIEHARRNAEMLNKIIYQIEDKSLLDIRTLAIESLKKNIAVMNEVENIK